MSDQVAYLQIEEGAHVFDIVALDKVVRGELEKGKTMVVVVGHGVNPTIRTALLSQVAKSVDIVVQDEPELLAMLNAKDVFNAYGNRAEKLLESKFLSESYGESREDRRRKTERTYSKIPQRNNRK